MAEAPPKAGLALPDPDLAASVGIGMEQVEATLFKAVEGDDEFASAAARHLLDAGGKRLRPMLTLLCAHLGDGVSQAVVDAAAVVELTHLASLYHDDVIDSAPLRRGAPSAHEVYGATVAILTGDLLFAKASQIVAGLGAEAVLIQAQTFERLCLGQIHETVGPGQGDPVDHHMRVLADKTGALIATSARFGAMMAACPPPVIEALIGFGEAVGVAFQLADDIIDLTGPAALTGKTPGTDLREGVPTMPVLLVEQAAHQDLAAGRGQTESVDLAQALGQDLSDDAVLAGVVARLGAHPAMERSRQIALDWAGMAKAQLAALPAGSVKDALAATADLFVRRLA
ncbi:MAG: polyprenyl synthetase family protein [Micrococcales bacterium]|nr:polyprenyl synthetase family protein [Micrococcales bacterium]